MQCYLESCSLTSKLLILKHCLQNLLMATRHQAHSSQDFQDSHFSLYILCAEALSNGVDACWMCQHMGPSILQDSYSHVIFFNTIYGLVIHSNCCV